MDNSHGRRGKMRLRVAEAKTLETVLSPAVAKHSPRSGGNPIVHGPLLELFDRSVGQRPFVRDRRRGERNRFFVAAAEPQPFGDQASRLAGRGFV